MPIGDFLQGLLGGFATGMVNSSVAQRKQEQEEERIKMQTAAELLRSGNYEAFMLLDPKLLKGMGVADEKMQFVGALAGEQRQRREATVKQQALTTQGLENTVALSGMEVQERKDELAKPIGERRTTLESQRLRAQAQGAGVEAAEKQRGADVRGALSPEEQKTVYAPELGMAEDRKARADALQEQIAARRDASEAAHGDRVERMEQNRQQFELRLEETKAAREGRQTTAEESRADRKDRQAFMEEQKKLAVTATRLKDLDKRRDSALNQIDKVSSGVKLVQGRGKIAYGEFDTLPKAQAFEKRVNEHLKEVNKIESERAKIEEREPQLQAEWKTHPQGSGGLLGLIGMGSNTYLVGPPLEAQGTAGSSGLGKFLDEELDMHNKAGGTTTTPVAEPTKEPERTNVHRQASQQYNAAQGARAKVSVTSQGKQGPVGKASTTDAAEEFETWNSNSAGTSKLKPDEFIVFRELTQQGKTPSEAAAAIIKARR